MPPRLKTFKPFGESSYRGSHLPRQQKRISSEEPEAFSWSENIAQDFLRYGLLDAQEILASSPGDTDQEWVTEKLFSLDDLDSFLLANPSLSDIKEKSQEFRRVLGEVQEHIDHPMQRELLRETEQEYKKFIRESVPRLVHILSAAESSDDDAAFLKECFDDLNSIDGRPSSVTLSPELLSGIEGVREMHARAMAAFEKRRAFETSIEGFSEKFSLFLPRIASLEKHMALLGRGAERLPLDELGRRIYEISQEYFSLYDDMNALLSRLHTASLLETDVMKAAQDQLGILEEKLDGFGDIYKAKLAEQKPQRRFSAPARSSRPSAPERIPGEEGDDWRAQKFEDTAWQICDRVENVLRLPQETEQDCLDFFKESGAVLRAFDQHDASWQQHGLPYFRDRDEEDDSRAWRDALLAHRGAAAQKDRLLHEEDHVSRVLGDFQKLRSIESRRRLALEQGEEFAQRTDALLKRFDTLKALSRDSRRKKEVLPEMKELSASLDGFLESWEHIARPFLVDFPASEELPSSWRKAESDYRKIQKEKVLFDMAFEDFLAKDARRLEQEELERGNVFLDGCRQAVTIAKNLVNARPVNPAQKEALRGEISNFFHGVEEFTSAWDIKAVPYFERPVAQQAAVWQTAKKEYEDFLVLKEKLSKKYQKLLDEKSFDDEKRLAAEECERGSVTILETLDRLKAMPRRSKKDQEAFRKEAEQFLHLYEQYQEYWFEFIAPRVVAMDKDKTFTPAWRSALDAREAVLREVDGLRAAYARSFGEDAPSWSALQARALKESQQEDEDRKKKEEEAEEREDDARFAEIIQKRRAEYAADEAAAASLRESLPEPVALPPVEKVSPVAPLKFAPNDASLDAVALHKDIYPERHEVLYPEERVSALAKKAKKFVGRLLGREAEEPVSSEKMISVPVTAPQMTEAFMRSLVERHGKDAVQGVSEYLTDIHPLLSAPTDIPKES